MKTSTPLLALGATLGLSVALLGSVPVADASHLSPPDSIAADCSVDVAAELEAWLRAQSSNSKIRFPADACYRVEREMKIAKKQGWTLDGNGALLRRDTYTPPELRYPKANAFLRLVGFESSTIQGFRIRGTNIVPDSRGSARAGSYRMEVEFDHGLALHGATSVVVRDLQIDGVWGDGIYIAGHDQHTRLSSRDVTVADVTISRNGRQGIAINRSSHVLLDRVNITFSRRAGVDMEPRRDDEIIDQIEIRNSHISSNLLAFAAGGRGQVNNVNIHHNVVGASGIPVVFSGSGRGIHRYNWRIADNTVEHGVGSPRPAFRFINVHGIVVSGNDLRLAPRQSRLAVGLEGSSSGAVVTCNRFVNARSDFVAGRPSAFVQRLNQLTDGGRVPHCSEPAAVPKKPVAASPKPKQPTRAQFNASEPASRGRWLALHGQISKRAGGSWRPVAKAQVLVQFRPRGETKFKTRAVLVSDKRGRIDGPRLVRAYRDGTWRLVLRPSAKLSGTTSRRDYVNVRGVR